MTPEYVRARLALKKRASILPFLVGGGLGAGLTMLLNRGTSTPTLPTSTSSLKPSETEMPQPTTIADRLAKKPVTNTGSTLRNRLQHGFQNVASSQTGEFFTNLFNKYFKK